MSVIYIILPLALVVVLIAVIAYVWAAKRGQFDDMQTPAMRMLHDDEPGRRSDERAGVVDADASRPGPGDAGEGPRPGA
jgi:cbb3-type cytochrome oxidase maturation protein